MSQLLTLEEAAEKLGVPVAGIRCEAERHGFLVRMGRSLRIEADTLGELIEKCRENPQDRASTGIVPAASTTSAKAGNSSARARETARKLKESSRRTSRRSTAPSLAPVIPLK